MKSVCLLLLLGWMPLAAQNPVEQPITIAISTPTPSVSAGSDVWVDVKLTNHSHENLDESGSISDRTGRDPYLVFEVRDQHGELAAKRVYEHPELASGSPVNRYLKPGETLMEQLNISRLYDITKSGSYVVQVSRESSGGLHCGVVKSNKITFVVAADLP